MCAVGRRCHLRKHTPIIHMGIFFSMFLNTFFLTKKKGTTASLPGQLASPVHPLSSRGLWLWLQPRSVPWAGLGQGRSSPHGCGAAAAPHPIGPRQDLSWGVHLQGLASSRVGAKLSGGTRQVSAGRELGAAGKCVLDLWPWELLAGCARGSRGAPAPQGTA